MRRNHCQAPEKSRVGSVAGMVLAVVAIAALTACNRGAAEGPQGPPVMPVKVQKIGTQELGQASDYTATIKSRNSATIMSDVEGWIFAINVTSGEVVKQGQSLMEIDPRRQAATVSNWESQRAAKAGESSTRQGPTGPSQGTVRVRCNQPTGVRPGAICLRRSPRGREVDGRPDRTAERSASLFQGARCYLWDRRRYPGARWRPSFHHDCADHYRRTERVGSVPAHSVGARQRLETRAPGANPGLERERGTEHASEFHLSAGGHLDPDDSGKGSGGPGGRQAPRAAIGEGAHHMEHGSRRSPFR